MWNLEYTTGADSGCAQAENKGLACLTQRGSWNNLKQLNRPAILSVIDTQGTTHNVVLTAIHGDSAELSIGGVPVTHLVSTILEFWYGEYTLPGSRGPEVIWLRQSLDNIDERYTTIANDFYDNKLATVVRQFQRDYRLHVDGLAGQQTQIIVTTLLGPNGSPRLTRD
jgi:general secretion pathway protein A